MSNTKKVIEWVILITIGSLIAVSCDTPQLEDNIYPELKRDRGQAFPTTNGSQDYIQTIYLDTIESFTYTKIYAESSDMDDDQKYNGESNILATFSTDKHWHYSDGVFNDYPVYYVYPTSVRFVPPADRYEYQPTELALMAQQLVGPIPKSAIVNQETVKIYMDVSYDGEYHVRDSLLIELRPR